jgi:hypothetical protein
MIDFLLFLLQGIPEIAGVIALSLAIAGVTLRWKIIVPMGTVLVVIVFILRNLPFTFGLHTVICLLLAVVFIVKATRVLLSKSLIAIFLALTVLAVLELIIHEAFFAFTQIDPQVYVAKSLFWVLLGLPQALLMIVIALLAARIKKPAEGMWKI